MEDSSVSYRYGTNPEPYPLPMNTLWRYESGSTALVMITSLHEGAKGYHGTQCMGGTVFVSHDNIKPASDQDYRIWFERAHWRKA